MKKSLKCVLLLAALSLFLAMPALAQNTVGPPGPQGEPKITPNAVTLTINTPFFSAPYQVARFHVKAANSSTLAVQVADVATSGDHWQVKVIIHDRFPNEAVATALGTVGLFSAPATVTNYGMFPLDALVEVRYLHGINIFSANAALRITTNGTIAPVITSLGVSNF